MNQILRRLFFGFLIRPFVNIVLGLHVRHAERLPSNGPAIVIANHNSHLDTMVLISLFPGHLLKIVRPVAAADYFLRNPLMAWFSLKIIGIIPLNRRVSGGSNDPLKGCSDALEKGEILILFPEGSRGDPERLSSFKSGIAHLAKRHPDVPLTPIFLHGLGKALPRGGVVLVPFSADVMVGEKLTWPGDRQQFMDGLESRMHELAEEGHFAPWT